MNLSKPLLPAALSLRVNFSWTLLSNVVYAACQWGMLVVLAKLGTPTIVGQFSLGLALTAPVLMLTNLQLRAVQATDANREYRFGVYLLLRLMSTLLALLVIGGLVVWSGYRRDTGLVILVVGIAKSFEAVSDIFYGLLQQAERMDKIAISMLWKGPLSLIAMGITMYLSENLVWSVTAMTLSWGMVLCLYDIPAGKWVLGAQRHASVWPDRWPSRHPSWQLAKQMGRLAWLSAPLGIVMMLISLNTSIPRLFLQRDQGEYALGIFSAMVFLIVTGTTIVQALGQSVTPRLASLYRRGERTAYLHLVGYLMAISTVLALGGIALALIGGKFLLRIIYAPQYAEYADLFVLVMVAGGLQYVASLLGYTMTAARYFKIQIVLFLAVTVATAVACALLTPTMGIAGAVWSLVLAGAVQLLGCLLINLSAIQRLSAAQ